MGKARMKKTKTLTSNHIVLETTILYTRVSNDITQHNKTQHNILAANSILHNCSQNLIYLLHVVDD